MLMTRMMTMMMMMILVVVVVVVMMMLLIAIVMLQKQSVPGDIAMLQAAKVHDGGAYFVLEIESWRHLHGVVEVQRGQAGVAEEEGASCKLLAEAYLERNE
jgi:hypothetical protein